MGEWSDLLAYVENNTSGFKAQTLNFYLESIIKKMLERKYKILKKRLVVATASVAAIPVPGVDVVINTVSLVHEVRHYMRVFGVEQERVNALKDFDHSLLKFRYLLKPSFNMMLFVGTEIGIYSAIMFAQSFLNCIVSMSRSVIYSAATAAVTYRFLDNMLQDIKDDAVLLHEHVMKTNADHRM